LEINPRPWGLGLDKCTYTCMKLLKPVKRWALGFRVSSKMNKSFNWVEFSNSFTFDTKEEAEKFMAENTGWNQHVNKNNPSVKIKYCGPFQLTDAEMVDYNNRT